MPRVVLKSLAHEDPAGEEPRGRGDRRVRGFSFAATAAVVCINVAAIGNSGAQVRVRCEDVVVDFVAQFPWEAEQ